jgi:hypothetical protein
MYICDDFLVQPEVGTAFAGYEIRHGMTIESSYVRNTGQHVSFRNNSGESHMDPRLGLLHTLSPDMARELDQAFSLASIESAGTPAKNGPRPGGGKMLRIVTRVLLFLGVTTIAVSITAAALALTRLT